MASAERETECTVCFEVFVDPKLLPCRHSYCNTCIQELTKGSKLQCPMCKSVCDVDQIVHDFQTERFVQAFKELEEEFNRKLERATAASAYPEPSAPPEHTITALKKCELCSSNDIAFWCVECKQWICIPCKKIHLNTSFAKDHHIEKLSVKNKGVKSLLQSEIDSLKVKINEFHKYITKLQAEKKNTQDIQVKTLQQSKELRAQCILEVNNKFNRIDNHILAGTDKYSSLLERELSKYQKRVLELETKYQSFVATIKKDPKLATDGGSEVEKAKSLLRKTKSPDMCIESLTIKIQRLKDWSAQAVTFEINGGNILLKAQTITNVSLEMMGSRQWTRHQSVSLRGSPCRLHNIGNQLYQCHTYGITVYDARPKRVRGIQCLGDMGKVYDVCDMPNGDMIFATVHGLYHATVYGFCVKKIIEGCFTSVVRNQNRYYAAETRTTTIHVYEYAGQWFKCHSFSVNATKGHILTMCFANNLLFVCLCADHRRDIFSPSGHLQSSTGCKGSEGPDQFINPHSCATDAGAVLIADSYNNRLQLLNANGQWCIVQLQPPVKGPCGACLMNDTLYVNEWSYQQLHAYKME